MRWALAFIALLAILAMGLFFRLADYDNDEDFRNAVSEFKSGRYANALPILESEAQQGRRTALFLVALAYSHGWGVERDFEHVLGVVDDVDCPCDKGALKYDVAMELARNLAGDEDRLMIRNWLESAALINSSQAAENALRSGWLDVDGVKVSI